jgi:hypothetical protein
VSSAQKLPSCWQYLGARAIPRPLFPKTWEKTQEKLRTAERNYLEYETAFRAAIDEGRRRLLAGVDHDETNPQWDLKAQDKLIDDLRLGYVDDDLDKLARTPSGRARLWYQLRQGLKGPEEIRRFQNAVLAIANDPALYDKLTVEIDKLKGLFQASTEAEIKNLRSANPGMIFVSLEDLLKTPDDALYKSFRSHVSRSYMGFGAWFGPSAVAFAFEHYLSLKIILSLGAVFGKSFLVGIDGQMNRVTRQVLWRLEPYLRAARATSPELRNHADPLLAELGKALGTIDDHTVDEDLAKLMKCYDSSMVNGLQRILNRFKIQDSDQKAAMCVNTIDNMLAISGVTLVNMRRRFERSKDHLILLMQAVSQLDALVTMVDYYKQRQELESFYEIDEGPEPVLEAHETFHGSIWKNGQRPHPLEFDLGLDGIRAVLFKDMSQDGARLSLFTPMADALLTRAGFPAPGHGRMSVFRNLVAGIYGGSIRPPDRQLVDLKAVIDRLPSQDFTLATVEHLIEGRNTDEWAASAAALVSPEHSLMTSNPHALGVFGTYQPGIAGLRVEGLQPYSVRFKDQKYVMEPSEEMSVRDFEEAMLRAGFEPEFIDSYRQHLSRGNQFFSLVRDTLRRR